MDNIERATQSPLRAFRRSRTSAALLTSSFFLLTLIFAPSGASAADLAFDGRWLDAGSNAVANASVPATMNVYTNDAADAEAVASAPVTLATDAEGYFLAVATNLALPPGCRTYWLGVTPQNGTEIAPRMRVSPAPFAIRAAEARALEADELQVEGTVTIGHLTNATATVGTVAVTDNLRLQCGFGGADTLYLGGIDIGPGGPLSLFRRVSHETFAIQTRGGGSLWNGHNTHRIWAPDDGFVVISITPRYPQAAIHMTLDNGDFSIGCGSSIFNGLGFDDGRSRHFMLPVRKKRTVTLNLEATLPIWVDYHRDDTVLVDCTLYCAGVE